MPDDIDPMRDDPLRDEDGRDEDGQMRVDRDAIDFDPDEGLYSGTAVDGTSRIPGPHERGAEIDDAAASPPEGADDLD